MFDVSFWASQYIECVEMGSAKRATELTTILWNCHIDWIVCFGKCRYYSLHILRINVNNPLQLYKYNIMTHYIYDSYNGNGRKRSQIQNRGSQIATLRLGSGDWIDLFIFSPFYLLAAIKAKLARQHKAIFDTVSDMKSDTLDPDPEWKPILHREGKL